MLIGKIDALESILQWIDDMKHAVERLSSVLNSLLTESAVGQISCPREALLPPGDCCRFERLVGDFW